MSICKNEQYGIAIDIGTTTLVAALVTESGKVLREHARPNSQCKLGADVMSRIRAATDGHAGKLRALVQTDLTALILELLKEFCPDLSITGNRKTSIPQGAPPGKAPPTVEVSEPLRQEKKMEWDTASAGPTESSSPTAIVLTGNTTMLHLLYGYDCSGLGRYPYTPVTLRAEEHPPGGISRIAGSIS